MWSLEYLEPTSLNKGVDKWKLRGDSGVVLRQYSDTVPTSSIEILNTYIVTTVGWSLYKPTTIVKHSYRKKIKSMLLLPFIIIYGDIKF